MNYAESEGSYQTQRGAGGDVKFPVLQRMGVPDDILKLHVVRVAYEAQCPRTSS